MGRKRNGDAARRGRAAWGRGGGGWCAGIAYALLAGVPAVYGLYSSIMTMFTYPFFGTSPHVVMGTVAMMSLLTAEAAVTAEPDDTKMEHRLSVVFLLTVMVGAVLLLMGLFRGGFVMHFLANPVLRGYTTAAAVIIGSSQVSAVVGFPIPRSRYVFYVAWMAIDGLAKGQGHALTMVFSLICVLSFVLLRWGKIYLLSTPCVKARKGSLDRVVRAFPNAVVVVVLSTVIAWKFRLDEQGLKVVGDVPSGFPAVNNVFASKTLFDDAWLNIMPALAIALMGYVESFSGAKVMALMRGTTVDANQEFIGLGASNFLGAFFGSIPVGGALARSIVAEDAGARTTLAGFFAGGLMLVLLLFATPTLFFLPVATLGSMILFAVYLLLDWETPRGLWAVDHNDFAIWVVSFLATLGLGAERGIFVGIGISLVRLIREAARPMVSTLGRMPDGKSWRSIRRFPGLAKEEPGVVVLRFEGNLFFGNANKLHSVVMSKARQKDPVTNALPDAIVLDCSTTPNIDSSGVAELEALWVDLAKQTRAQFQERARVLQREARRKHWFFWTPRRPQLPPLDVDVTTRLEDVSIDEQCMNRPEACTQRAKELMRAANPDTKDDSGSPLIQQYTPRLFLACVHEKVKQRMQRNDAYTSDLRRRKEKASRPSFWNCLYPCPCRNPCKSDDSTTTSAPVGSGQHMPGRGALMEVTGAAAPRVATYRQMDKEEQEAAREAIEDSESVSATESVVPSNASAPVPSTTHVVLLKHLLADQDVDDAVTYVLRSVVRQRPVPADAQQERLQA